LLGVGGGGGRQKAAKWIIGRPDAFSPPNHPCSWLRQCNRRCFVTAFYIVTRQQNQCAGKNSLDFEKHFYKNEVVSFARSAKWGALFAWVGTKEMVLLLAVIVCSKIFHRLSGCTQCIFRERRAASAFCFEFGPRVLPFSGLDNK
jgi:hypothetical protein